MANITYNIYRRYSKTEKPIPVATGLVNPTYEIPNIDYDRDVYLSVGRVTNKLEVYGEEYKYFIPFETPTIEASYADGVITVSWGDNPIYVDDLYLYTSNEVITEDALPPPTVLGKGVTTATVNEVLAADEMAYVRLGSVRNNNVKLSNEISISVFEAPYDVIPEFRDDAINLSWKLDGFVDEQRYYCSETPIDVNNLPEPKSILVGDARSHTDADIDLGMTYYICVGAVKGGNEKLSSEISIGTSPPLFDPIYISSLFSIVDHDSDVLISDGRVVEWKDRKVGYKFTNNASDSPSAGTLNDKRILNFSSDKLTSGSDFLSLRNNASSL